VSRFFVLNLCVKTIQRERAREKEIVEREGFEVEAH
jgi:hypothetical protein